MNIEDNESIVTIIFTAGYLVGLIVAFLIGWYFDADLTTNDSVPHLSGPV